MSPRSADSRCNDFEREGLLRMEQGLEPSAHERGCPECQAARTSYLALRESVRHVGEGGHPKLGWQSRVLAKTRDAERSRRWIPGLFAGGAVLTLAGLVAIGVVPSKESAREESLELNVLSTPTQVRGEGASPGSTVEWVLRGPPGPTRSLRLYRDDRTFVVACPGDTPCSLKDGELRLRATIETPGTYRALWLSSELPLPSQGLDADVARAKTQGLRFGLSEPLHVH
jgi:hypothetical protein